jgi:hypothetical protein
MSECVKVTGLSTRINITHRDAKLHAIIYNRQSESPKSKDGAVYNYTIFV